MKISANVILGLMLTAAPAFAQGGNAAVEKQLVANERAINDAVAKGDLKRFSSMTDPSASSVDGMGIMPVSDLAKMLPTIKLSAWDIDATRVMWLSPDAAIVMYRWTGKGTMSGQPIPSPTWASTVWTKQSDGKWLARFHQESVAIPSPPPAKK